MKWGGGGDLYKCHHCNIGAEASPSWPQSISDLHWLSNSGHVLWFSVECEQFHRRWYGIPGADLASSVFRWWWSMERVAIYSHSLWGQLPMPQPSDEWPLCCHIDIQACPLVLSLCSFMIYFLHFPPFSLSLCLLPPLNMTLHSELMGLIICHIF